MSRQNPKEPGGGSQRTQLVHRVGAGLAAYETAYDIWTTLRHLDDNAYETVDVLAVLRRIESRAGTTM